MQVSDSAAAKKFNDLAAALAKSTQATVGSGKKAATTKSASDNNALKKNAMDVDRYVKELVTLAEGSLDQVCVCVCEREREREREREMKSRTSEIA